MILLRRVIGDALRARRQDQHRTLRDVSTAANVSLGYLSEIERGQKEASSELLASVCDALGTRLSEVLHDVTETVTFSEEMEAAGMLAPVGADAVPHSADKAGTAPTASVVNTSVVNTIEPLERAVTRTVEAPARHRDVVCAA